MPVDTPGEQAHGRGGEQVQKNLLRPRNIPEYLTRFHWSRPPASIKVLPGGFRQNQNAFEKRMMKECSPSQ
jgi:hypothetical protein